MIREQWSNQFLTNEELEELSDSLAMQIHAWLGASVFWLQRGDVFDLIAPYVDDLSPEDQHALSWMVWQLFQEAREIHVGYR